MTTERKQGAEPDLKAETNKPEAKKPEAKKPEVKETSKPAQLDARSIRQQPSDEELAERKAQTKGKQQKHVKVQTVSGGDMWDPDGSQWIEGRPTLAEHTDWLDRQAKAKKITFLK